MKHISNFIGWLLLLPLLCAVPSKQVSPTAYCFFASTPDEARQVCSDVNGRALSWQNGIASMNAVAPEKDGYTFYPEQWLSVQQESDVQLGEDGWHLEAIRATQVWEATQGEAVTVAVVDTGIESSHPEFAQCLVGAETVIPDSAYQQNGYFRPEYAGPLDYLGHGTHVAGLIAAQADGIGSTGAAPMANILSIKALESDGVRGSGKTSWVAAAIQMAVDAGANIINLSIGGAVQENALLLEAIRRATESGVLVVCAAGNSATDAPCYPAAYPETIAVSAVRRQGDTFLFASSYSNYGSWVDICAPGSNLYGPGLGGSYGFLTGTSMACPLVSAGAALLLSRDPALTPGQIRRLLSETAEDLGAPGRDERYGCGMLNLEKALALLQERNQLLPPDSDCADGSVLTDTTTVNWRTNNLHGEIHYTLDGSVPDADSPLWPVQGRTFPVGQVDLTLAVQAQGQWSSSIRVQYTIVPDITLLNEIIGTLEVPIPTYGAPVRRFRITIGAGETLACSISADNGSVSAELMANDSTIKTTNSKGKFTWCNNAKHNREVILKLTGTDAPYAGLHWECTFPPEPTTAPYAPPTAPATEPETTAVTESTTVPESSAPAPTETVFTEPETEDSMFHVELLTETEPISQSEAPQEDMTEKTFPYGWAGLMAAAILLLLRTWIWHRKESSCSFKNKS